MSDARDRLVWAAATTLHPIVKRLLALGVPFGQLEARLRELFVEVAEADLALPGRRQTDSRIALVTGINRKEVKRIRSADRRTDAPRSFSMNQATSLISRWMTDAQTTDRRGRPLAIPYRAKQGPSFMRLARKVTGDLAPRVLLDELMRGGAIEAREGNLLALKSDAYVPKLERVEQLQILAEDPPELIDTILRNVFAGAKDPLLQRKVYYDNLGSDAAHRIRAEMRREGERFLRRINRLLSRYDRDRNPKAPGGERHYAGVGVYFFEAAASARAETAGKGPARSAAPRTKERRR